MVLIHLLSRHSLPELGHNKLITLITLVTLVMASLPPLQGSYATALKLIDDAHAQDPNKTPSADGSGEVPYELHYAQKMTRFLALRCPDASPELQVACRAQHFRRFVASFLPFPPSPDQARPDQTRRHGLEQGGCVLTRKGNPSQNTTGGSYRAAAIP